MWCVFMFEESGSGGISSIDDEVVAVVGEPSQNSPHCSKFIRAALVVWFSPQGSNISSEDPPRTTKKLSTLEGAF